MTCDYMWVMFWTYTFLLSIRNDRNDVGNAISYIPPKYAEERYSKPNVKTHIMKTIKHSLPLKFDSICGLEPYKFSVICREICNDSKYRGRYSIKDGPMPQKCVKRRVKFLYSPTKQEIKAWVRKCPTIPPLWISEGNFKHSVFLYTRINDPGSKFLKFYDHVEGLRKL